jgi:hypothetical protein
VSGPSFSVKFLGSRALDKILRDAKQNGQRAADAGRYAVGLTILARAIPITPKKWGVLRGSGYVTHPANGVVTVGFGGPAAAYAWVQHERMDFKHTEGGPKYLENAVNAVAPQAANIFGRIVEKSLLENAPLPPLGGAPSTPWEGPTSPNRARGTKARKMVRGKRGRRS